MLVIKERKESRGPSRVSTSGYQSKSVLMRTHDRKVQMKIGAMGWTSCESSNSNSKFELKGIKKPGASRLDKSTKEMSEKDEYGMG